jgi:pimeloyl-ACP methyl ester carboxylesterase
VLGANYNNDGLVPGVVEGFATLKPDDAAEFRDAYAKVAPDPKHLPTLVAKVMRQAVEMFRLRPRAQLAVLPGTTHFAPIERAHLVAALTSAFLEAPVSAEP